VGVNYMAVITKKLKFIRKISNIVDGIRKGTLDVLNIIKKSVSLKSDSLPLA